MQKRFLKIIKRIIMIFVLIIIFIPQTKSNAALTDKQKNDVINLCEKLSSMGIVYDLDAINSGNTYKCDLAYYNLQEAPYIYFERIIWY